MTYQNKHNKGPSAEVFYTLHEINDDWLPVLPEQALAEQAEDTQPQIRTFQRVAATPRGRKPQACSAAKAAEPQWKKPLQQAPAQNEQAAPVAAYVRQSLPAKAAPALAESKLPAKAAPAPQVAAPALAERKLPAQAAPAPKIAAPALAESNLPAKAAPAPQVAAPAAKRSRKARKAAGQLLPRGKALKRTLISLASAAALAMLVFFGSWLLNDGSTAYAIQVEGQTVAVLESKQQAEQALQQALVAATGDSQAQAYISENVRLQKAGANAEIISTEQAVANLLPQLTVVVKGYLLLADGKEAGYFASRAQAKEAVDLVLSTYAVAGTNNIISVYAEEDLQLVPLQRNSTELTPVQKAANTLLGKGSERLLTVNVERLITAWESQPFSKEVLPSDLLDIGEEELVTAGINGVKEVTYQVLEQNGVQVAAEILSETVIVEPVNELVAVGHAVILSSRAGTTAAVFIWPIENGTGSISSRFGMRSSGNHTGIDIAAEFGINVVASEGGTVSYCGWYGGYGNLVIIDHGNGIETYYGHNSAILVEEGQQVARGELIALVGNTGNSTGSHVHLEIRIDGEPVDPLLYLAY